MKTCHSCGLELEPDGGVSRTCGACGWVTTFCAGCDQDAGPASLECSCAQLNRVTALETTGVLQRERVRAFLTGSTRNDESG